jgi:hypothetical protein
MVLKYNAKTGKYEDDGTGAPKAAYPSFSSIMPTYGKVSGATTARENDLLNSDPNADPSTDPNRIDVPNTGGSGSGSGVSNADGRRGANQAARIQRRSGARGQQEYNQASQDVYRAYLDAIAPIYSQQEQSTATQKAAAMELLNKQLEMAQANITRANQDWTAGNTAPSAAYSAAPIMQMSPQQNMLAAGIQGFGASMDPVAQQSASDAEYARATAELARRSAEQLNQGQQNYMNAYKQQGASDLNQTQQQLALQQLLGASNIDAEAMKSLNEITGNKSQAQIQGLDLQLGLIQKGIEAAMAGRQASAETRAAGAAKYGLPAKKKNTGRKK